MARCFFLVASLKRWRDDRHSSLHVGENVVFSYFSCKNFSQVKINDEKLKQEMFSFPHGRKRRKIKKVSRPLQSWYKSRQPRSQGFSLLCLGTRLKSRLRKCCKIMTTLRISMGCTETSYIQHVVSCLSAALGV